MVLRMRLSCKVFVKGMQLEAVAVNKGEAEPLRYEAGTDLEQAQGLDFVQLIEREAVVDARGYDQRISRGDVNADPCVRGVSEGRSARFFVY